MPEMHRFPRGFTLIELLIVVVVIGILATIAIPRFSEMRLRAYVAAVTSDLKNAASQQEIYLNQYYTYASSIDQLDMELTDAVSVTINESTGTGWAATAAHSGLSDTCGVFFGSASPANGTPATTEGAVACN